MARRYRRKKPYRRPYETERQRRERMVRRDLSQDFLKDIPMDVKLFGAMIIFFFIGAIAIQYPQHASLAIPFFLFGIIILVVLLTKFGLLPSVFKGIGLSVRYFLKGLAKLLKLTAKISSSKSKAKYLVPIIIVILILVTVFIFTPPTTDINKDKLNETTNTDNSEANNTEPTNNIDNSIKNTISTGDSSHKTSEFGFTVQLPENFVEECTTFNNSFDCRITPDTKIIFVGISNTSEGIWDSLKECFDSGQDVDQVEINGLQGYSVMNGNSCFNIHNYKTIMLKGKNNIYIIDHYTYSMQSNILNQYNIDEEKYNKLVQTITQSFKEIN